MNEISIDVLINQLDIKINEVAKLKSVLTRFIQATTVEYNKLKKYTCSEMMSYVQSQMYRYQVSFHESINQMANFFVKKIRQARSERDIYKKESFELKQEVQRQQKVIALMKQEVEDLMLLLNSQRVLPQKEDQNHETSPTQQNRSIRNIGRDSGTLQIIQEQQTERTIVSSAKSARSFDDSQNYIKIEEIQQKLSQKKQEDQYSLSSDEPRLFTDPNPHLQSIFVPEEYQNTQMKYQNNASDSISHDYFESELDGNESEMSEQNVNVKTEERKTKVQLMDLSNKFINENNSERMFRKDKNKNEEDYQPKTKQFLEQFRKTFNKCLNSIHASKKYSTKTNSKQASGNMQVTFGKQANSSNYSSNKSKDSSHKIENMLKNLDSINKFTVGNKKIELKYEGEKKNGIRHGNGVLFYSNGLCFEGEFKDGCRHGYGILKFNHIEIYNGDWVNDEIEGRGKIRNCAIINKKKSINVNTSCLSKWISYSGEFKGSKFQGEGTLYLQGGQKFVGIFMAGNACGEGTIYRKNGQAESGFWKNNILMEEY